MMPSEGESVLTNIVYSWIPSGIGQSILSLFIIFITATQINRICVKHRLLSTLNLIPGLFFILLSSLIPSFLPLSSVMMAMFFVVLVFASLMQTYKSPKAADLIFNAGFFTGVACLFSFSSFLFIIAAYIGFLILRSFKMVERFQLLIGFLLPLMFFGVYLFYNDILAVTIQKEIVESLKLSFSFGTHTIESIIVLSIGTLFLLVNLLSYGLYTSKKSIQSQKKIDILYWVILSCIISLFFNNGIQLTDLLMLTFPISILISMNFLALANKMILELIHLAMMIGILLIHFVFLV